MQVTLLCVKFERSILKKYFEKVFCCCENNTFKKHFQNKILLKSILKIQNKILWYFQNKIVFSKYHFAQHWSEKQLGGHPAKYWPPTMVCAVCVFTALSGI